MDTTTKIHLFLIGLLLIAIIVYFIFRAILLIRERSELDIEDVEIKRKVSKINTFVFDHK